MDVSIINPFLEAVKNILGQFGVQDIKRGNLYKKEQMSVKTDVSAIIGIIGSFKGNVAYSMSKNTAIKIVSAMMMGMPVTELDEMGKSAIGELSNMITATASTILSENGYKIDITPPTIIYGEDAHFKISAVETIVIELITAIGTIEVNVGIK